MELSITVRHSSAFWIRRDIHKCLKKGGVITSRILHIFLQCPCSRIAVDVSVIVSAQRCAKCCLKQKLMALMWSNEENSVHWCNLVHQSSVNIRKSQLALHPQWILKCVLLCNAQSKWRRSATYFLTKIFTAVSNKQWLLLIKRGGLVASLQTFRWLLGNRSVCS